MALQMTQALELVFKDYDNTIIPEYYIDLCCVLGGPHPLMHISRKALP